MFDLMTLLMPLALVFVTLLALLVVAGVLHFTSKREEGWLHLAVYGILLATAVINLTSGRDISNGADAGYAAQAEGLSTPGAWTTRFASFGILLLTAERIGSYILRASSGAAVPKAPRLLLPSFVLFWLCTSLLPMFLGAHSVPFTKEYIYTLLIGIAFILSTDNGAERATIAARDGIAWLNIAGLITAFVSPGLVVDSTCGQGLITGMSRFTGLSQHAVIHRLTVQFRIFCLWAKPYKTCWVNVGASTLLLTSSMLPNSGRVIRRSFDRGERGNVFLWIYCVVAGVFIESIIFRNAYLKLISSYEDPHYG